MVLFVLRKLVLQTCMHSNSVALDIWWLVGHFVYFHTSCVWTGKALARLHRCAGSPEPLLVAYVISAIISWAGSNSIDPSTVNFWAELPVLWFLFLKMPEITFFFKFSQALTLRSISPSNIFLDYDTSFCKSFYIFLYPATQKVAGYYVIPSELWVSILLSLVCLSALRFHALTLEPFDLFSSNFA